MQQSLNGTVVVGNDKFAIARESDLVDLMTSTPRETQFRVVDALKKLCATFGETRSPAMDLYRQRLSQMRTHMRMV